MPKVTWICADGDVYEAEVPEGHNLMEAAVANDVPGIIGECGGCLSCATCHVYVDEDWLERVGPSGDVENEMLSITEAQRTEASRLSCQIVMRGDLDGLVVHVP